MMQFSAIVAALVTIQLVGAVRADCECATAADTNGDGVVDPLDVGYVLSRFGCPVGSGDEACDAADANGDAVVDPLDSGYVLSRLGETSSPCEDAPIFASPAFDVGDDASDMIVQDFDGDCAADLVVSHQFNDKDVLFAKGKGDGFFDPPAILDTDSDPRLLAAGDFDADGDLDFVVEAEQGNICGVDFFSNSGADFELSSHSAIEGPLSELLAGDLNGDGASDLVAGVSNDWGVFVALNEGNGSFLPPVQYLDFFATEAIALGDVDADGDLDVAESTFEGRVILLSNDGDGTFNLSASYSVGSEPVDLVMEDFNNDGSLDVLTANYASNDLSLLLNEGDGTMAPDILIPVDEAPSKLSAGDPDGDADVDVLVFFDDAEQMIIMVNDAAEGTFEAVALDRSVSALETSVADLNRDGLDDFAILIPDDDRGFALLGDSNRVVEDCAFYPVSDPQDIAAGDLDGDGDLDLATGYSLLFNNGTGAFPATTDYFDAPGDRTSVVITDVDGDEDGDLVYTLNHSLDSVVVRLNAGDGTLGEEVKYGNLLSPTSVASGHLDQDGFVDLVVANGGINRVSVFLNSGEGTFPSESKLEVANTSHSVVLGDMDSDDDMDIVFASYSAETVSILLNNGDGSFAPATDYPTREGPWDLLVGDINGDTYLDGICTQFLSAGFTILFGNGDGTLGDTVQYDLDTSYQDGTLVDIDHDGDLDLVLADEHFDIVSILLNDGLGNLTFDGSYKAGAFPGSVVAGDFDADTFVDLAVANRTGDSVSVFLNKSSP